jgi:hypothetical protein
MANRLKVDLGLELPSEDSELPPIPNTNSGKSPTLHQIRSCRADFLLSPASQKTYRRPSSSQTHRRDPFSTLVALVPGNPVIFCFRWPSLKQIKSEKDNHFAAEKQPLIRLLQQEQENMQTHPNRIGKMKSDFLVDTKT